ncbi:hypothetical protein PGT21_019290 [Puccinia graminis f. sp. tritici]|uniref:Uncharacterized protein n=1 Tax=Puccinia graminis f. sp. tritici TaxID=56615 RepID=A0A5B0Q5X2_PUCGR|nr:hypothetical protein PGT21_019290 [Puccinia graminis f. sp. tritici]
MHQDYSEARGRGCSLRCAAHSRGPTPWLPYRLVGGQYADFIYWPPTSHPSERTYPPGTDRPKAYTRPRREKFRGILVQPDQSGSLRSEPIASSLLVVVTLGLHPRASQKDRDGPIASCTHSPPPPCRLAARLPHPSAIPPPLPTPTTPGPYFACPQPAFQAF